MRDMFRIATASQIVSAAFGGSAAIASSSNGGLPSGRSRSPGFDVENKQAPSSSSPSGDATAAATAAFLSVGNAPGTDSGGGGGGWLGEGADDFSTAAVGRKDALDHAFAGAMLQRSTSAPPVSDHVRRLIFAVTCEISHLAVFDMNRLPRKKPFGSR